MHPVLAALASPPPGARVALVVEGGGMRGAVTGGMALALHEAGLGHAFDAAYGSSAGTLNAFWLVSGRVDDGMPTWTDREFNRGLISKRRLLRGKPIVDVPTLIEERYEQVSPGLFGAALASPTELHPVATDVESGDAVDLHDHIKDERTLRLALRASSTLPLLAGPPVELGGRRWLDAGLSAAIPFRAAIADGATHLLVLRSRRDGDITEPPSERSARIMGGLLGRISPAVRQGFLTRAEREGADEALLAEHVADPKRTPHILSVRPARGSVVPGRLESDLDIVRAGLEAGHEAMREALSPLAPSRSSP